MGRPDGDRQDRRDAEGRHLPVDADRARSPSARLVQGAGRDARLRRHHRRHGHDVRTSSRPTRRYSADRHGQPSRYPADRRQVRRRARRAGRARGAARPASRRLRNFCADRSSQLDQRGRRAFRAADDRFRRVRRRLQPRLGLRADGPQRRNFRPVPWTRSAIAVRRPAATTNYRLFSRFTSSKAPISKPRARTSAW